MDHLYQQAVDIIIRRASQKVIVIEAIKLLESNLATNCDAVWVVISSPEVQLSRLMHNRNMSDSEARQRISVQVPQETRLASASVVIKNNSTFDDTWNQVKTAWQRHVPADDSKPIPIDHPVKLSLGEVHIERAGPKQIDEIAEVLNRLHDQEKTVVNSEIISGFGDTAFLIMRIEQNPMGVLGWQVENLISRTTEIALDPALPPAQYIPLMIQEIEKASTDLQCEVSLVFVPESLTHHDALWSGLGYERKASTELEVRAWQEAAEESMPAGTTLYFKRLREERILRPI